MNKSDEARDYWMNEYKKATNIIIEKDKEIRRLESSVKLFEELALFYRETSVRPSTDSSFGKTINSILDMIQQLVNFPRRKTMAIAKRDEHQQIRVGAKPAQGSKFTQNAKKHEQKVTSTKSNATRSN